MLRRNSNSQRAREGGPSFALLAGPIVLAALFVLSLSPRPVVAASPIFYRTVAIVSVHAAIKDIATVPAVRSNLPPEEPLRAPKPPSGPAALQKVSVEIVRVTAVERNEAPGPVVRPGEVIEVINQYADQEPPFEIGDDIEVRLRLVSAGSDAADPHRQWWFFPPGSAEEISPPRHPFGGIVVSRRR